jgi:hypothetical protein
MLALKALLTAALWLIRPLSHVWKHLSLCNEAYRLCARLRKTRRERLEETILDRLAGTQDWKSPADVRSQQHLEMLWRDISLREQLLHQDSCGRYWPPRAILAWLLEIRHRVRIKWLLASPIKIGAAMSSMARRGVLFRSPSSTKYRLNCGAVA